MLRVCPEDNRELSHCRSCWEASGAGRKASAEPQRLQMLVHKTDHTVTACLVQGLSERQVCGVALECELCP